MELVNLDLNDKPAILEFVRRAGPLGDGFRTWDDDHPNARGFARAIRDQRRRLRRLRNRRQREFASRRTEWVDQFARRFGCGDELVESWDSPEELADDFIELFVAEGETLAEFMSSAAAFKDLFRCYRWLWEHLPPDRWESPVWRDAHDSRPMQPVQAAALLGTQLTAAISEFGPILALSTRGLRVSTDLSRLDAAALPLLESSPSQAALVPGEEWSAMEATWQYGAPTLNIPTSAYEICCLQLFNHIVAGAQVRVCENPDCGQLYVRGYRRDGTPRRKFSPYCSETCGEVRRKRKQRANEGAPSKSSAGSRGA